MNNPRRILVFAASSSSTSINKTLATWAVNQMENVEADIVDLRDYDMPVYSEDRERENGIHPLAKQFKAKVDESDGIIISFAEHNGTFSAAFKNVYDWMSRLSKPIWSDKPMLLLSTSNGVRGAQSVLSTAASTLPYRGANVTASLSLPSYSDNFDIEKGVVTNQNWILEFEKALGAFRKALAEAQD